MHGLSTRLAGLLAAAALMPLAGVALAGQQPYVAYVGDDQAVPSFYTSEKHRQFLHANTAPVYDVETWTSQHPANAPEVCDASGTAMTNANALTPHGNAGWYQWAIVLPMKPRGNLAIAIQCGVLKDNARLFLGTAAITLCAGEMGERLGNGFCSGAATVAGNNPVNAGWLPKIQAIAVPGPHNSFIPFTMTAYRAVGSHGLSTAAGGKLTNSASLQVLDGSDNRTRVVLKACQDKSVLVKIPVAGQVNALGEVEADLEGGDVVLVRMTVPKGHSMDLYCHRHSLRIEGNGDPQTLLP